jgi:hypothetical protein
MYVPDMLALREIAYQIVSVGIATTLVKKSEKAMVDFPNFTRYLYLVK